MQPEGYCNHCQKELTRHDIRSTYVYSFKCRACGNEVASGDGFSTSLPAATDPNDIAAVDAWVEGLSPVFERMESERKIQWKRYSSNLLHQLEYDPESHGIVMLSVLTTELAASAHKNPADLQSRFSKHLVQPTGYSGSESSIFEGGASRAFWGCCCYLSTNTLHPELLNLIPRLEGYLADVLQSYR